MWGKKREHCFTSHCPLNESLHIANTFAEFLAKGERLMFITAPLAITQKKPPNERTLTKTNQREHFNLSGLLQFKEMDYLDFFFFNNQ